MPKRYVPGRGPREAKIAIVGEQPGKTEVMHGRPFIGPAGEELDKCLHTAGIIRSECYITNVVKDLDNPLKYYIDIPSYSTSKVKLSLQGQQYLEELKAELEYVMPNVVVATGNVPLYALTERRGITKWRGSVVPSSLVNGLKVVPCFHPSTILPKPPQHMGVYLNKHLISYDLRKALVESTSPKLATPQPLIHIEPSFDEAVEWLLQIHHSGVCGEVVDFDIEIVNEELNCFAFCTTTTEAFVIPLVKGGDYWTIDQEAEIMKLTAAILENPSITIRGQNIAFDIAFMQSRYGIVTNGDIHDTMIAQKITMADYPAGLDFICSMHTSFSYYKGEGKKYMKVGGAIETFWNYNGRDVLATATAHPNQTIDLERQQNVETYNRQRKLIPILVYMQNRGIRIDVQGMVDGREEVAALVKKKEEELYSMVGYQINYNSPQQMQRYFYDEKGIKPYTKQNSKGGRSVTCDVDALKRIARGTAQRAGMPEASLVMELRSLSTKTLGTYLSLDKVDPDGRYRSAYNPVGARTGRLSSSENIFGTGGNQQNWPHSLLKYLLADDGYVAYSIDLSQIENRIVAYVGRILEMIEAFEEGYDLHRLTAALLFDKHPDEVTTEDGTCEIGDGTHSERFWGKKSNHSLNYDIGYKEFALKNELIERDAKLIIEKYHHAYPGVRGNYHELVQSQLAKDRTLTNLFGRRRLFLDKWGRNLFKEAYAQIPQSTTADKINEQGLEFIYYNQQWFPHLEILRQVHDDVGFQLPLSDGFISHAKQILRIKSSLETPLEWHGRPFIIPADITMGLSFTKEEGHCLELKSKQVPNDPEALAKILEEAYHDILKAS